jgi:hypothetical protein
MSSAFSADVLSLQRLHHPAERKRASSQDRVGGAEPRRFRMRANHRAEISQTAEKLSGRCKMWVPIIAIESLQPGWSPKRPATEPRRVKSAVRTAI